MATQKDYTTRSNIAVDSIRKSCSQLRKSGELVSTEKGGIVTYRLAPKKEVAVERKLPTISVDQLSIFSFL